MNEIGKLVTKTQSGDVESFTLLVKYFQDMAVGYAYSILQDFHLAQDAVQEAFISAFYNIQKLRKPEAFAGWFKKIVFTQCSRLTRRKKIPAVSLESSVELVSDKVDIADDLERKAIRKTVLRAVQKLPEHERTVTLLFYISGYRLSEISDFLAVPRTTVKNRLHKAKLRLRTTMINELKTSLQENRPSKNDDFVDKIREILFQAARGDVVSIESALENDSSLINEIAPHPFWGGEASALHVAAEWGRKDVVEMLLKKGADPNGINEKYDGWSPLLTAIYQRRKPESRSEIINLLISYGAKIDIWAAAALGDVKLVQEILANSPQLINATGPNNATPLHFAATMETVKVLLKNGADKNAKDKYGKTPARSILNFGETVREAAIYLLNQTEEWDISAACAVGETKKIKQFIKQNPKLLAESGWDAETPLNIASQYGQVKVVKLLLLFGADVNFKAESGNYPLHLAAENGHISVTKILIANKADLFVLDDHYQAFPKDWADFQGRKEMVTFLEEQMKK